MKLLDPFAGYRLASGHPFLHVALFVGSWMVPLFGEDGFNSTSQIGRAFTLLRWAHFVIFTLAILQMVLNWASPIESKVKKIEQAADVEEQDKRLLTMKVVHRDGGKKLMSRIFATISVFAYQGTVFYAQMVLAT